MLEAVIWKGITPKGTTIQFRGRDFVVFNLVIQKEREAVQVFQSVQALIPGESFIPCCYCCYCCCCYYYYDCCCFLWLLLGLK